MKRFITKYEKQIEIIISTIGFALTIITLTHNIHLINIIVSLETLQVEYQNIKIDSLELILFFIPLRYRKTIVHFYHKHFCVIAWCNFLFFLGGTIYTNIAFGNSPFYHIGIIAFLEFIILTLEKNPGKKLHKLIDFIINILK